MTTVWTYPWAFDPDGIDDELADLRDAGVTGLSVAGHYHSIQTLLPGSGEAGLFESYPGGCHFELDPAHFEATDIDPPVNDSGPDGGGDAFGAVAGAAADAGLDVYAWTVCLHNTQIGAENPEYRVHSAFGDVHDHAPCPSRPAVRAYYEGVVRSLCNYGVDRVDLESLGFPDALHGHGDRFGHLKNHVVTSDAGRFLLSQCFCEGCRAAATDYGIELAAARTRVRDLLRQVVRGPTSEPPSVSALADSHEEVRALLSFRAAVVERFVRRLADASGDVPLHYYLADGAGYVPSAVESAGVDLARLGEHLDSLTAICYTADPAQARERIRKARASFDGPVHAGVTFDPSVVATADEFRIVTDAARDTATGDLALYNYSLLGETQREWLRSVA